MNSISNNENSLNTILTMASLGLSPNAVEGMIDFAGSKSISEKQRCYLFGPIVQQQSLWTESTPKWMYEAVFPERVAIIKKEIANTLTGWEIGPTELAVVLLPATLDSPLPYEVVQLYLWASAKATAKHKEVSVTEIWRLLDIHEISDDKITDADGPFYDVYKNLCTDIRERVVKAYQQNRAKSRVKKLSKEQSLSLEQQSFFDL